MGTIRITDLKLRALIGAHSWERVSKQDVLINILLEYDSSKACASDNFKDVLDYEALVKKITLSVGKSKYYLLEKLATEVLKLILKDQMIRFASVRIDKPQAIATAKSVSFEVYGENT